MATDSEYIKFVCEQLNGNYYKSYRKMFGDYFVYINGKPILLVCDNTVYVKKVAQLDFLMQDAECAIPFDGANEWYILDIENQELTESVIEILEPITAVSNKKKRSNSKM